MLGKLERERSVFRKEGSRERESKGKSDFHDSYQSELQASGIEGNGRTLHKHTCDNQSS